MLTNTNHTYIFLSDIKKIVVYKIKNCDEIILYKKINFIKNLYKKLNKNNQYNFNEIKQIIKECIKLKNVYIKISLFDLKENLYMNYKTDFINIF